MGALNNLKQTGMGALGQAQGMGMGMFGQLKQAGMGALGQVQGLGTGILGKVWSSLQFMEFISINCYCSQYFKTLHHYISFVKFASMLIQYKHHKKGNF